MSWGLSPSCADEFVVWRHVQTLPPPQGTLFPTWKPRKVSPSQWSPQKSWHLLVSSVAVVGVTPVVLRPLTDATEGRRACLGSGLRTVYPDWEGSWSLDVCQQEAERVECWYSAFSLCWNMCVRAQVCAHMHHRDQKRVSDSLELEQ